MKSIYQQAMGADFERLHPKIQERFGLTSETGTAHIGRGTMSRLWHGPWWTYPFLLLGTFRRIMFPEQGTDVPFTIRNYVYRDPLGRETVTWIRDFGTRHPRRFDAYMIFSEERQLVVDYMGSHQHLAVDLDLSVDPKGGMRIRSGEQRFYEGPLAFRFPMLLSGYAEVCEWFDDETERFQIEVRVSNHRLGPLFGYRGSFDVEEVPSEPVPAELLPLRVERRE